MAAYMHDIPTHGFMHDSIQGFTHDYIHGFT